MRIQKNVVAVATGLMVLATGAVNAGDVVISSNKLTIKGDLRLRYQNSTGTNGSPNFITQSNRERERFRLRVGMDYAVDSRLSVKTQFASGTGEQTSTNETFSFVAKQKALYIDLAYLVFKPLPKEWVDRLTVYGGRMKNPLWQTYTSDIVWDSDLNPEGLGQSFKTSLFGQGRVFVNAQQWVINEKKATADTVSKAGSRGQFAFSEQLGVVLPAPMDSRLTLTGALHDWVNETDRAFGVPAAAGTNSRVSSANNQLTNDFRVLELTGELFATLPALDLPVSFQGTYIQNTAHRDPATVLNTVDATKKQDMGYQVGVILGKASERNTFELAYFNKYAEQDSTVADAADSDFPGTNRKGHIFWVAYTPWKNQQFKVKYFDTAIIKNTSTAKNDNTTLQLDWQVKF